MSDPRLTIGYSPCPNDTHIFCALSHGLIATPGWQPSPPVLEDVETLNLWALQGRLDITKLSFNALGHVLDEYLLLRSGAALGRGCGPLLVAGRGIDPDQLDRISVAVPGKYTTAALLLRMYAPHCVNPVIMRFEEIMPAIVSGRVDAGVIIHESRFTYQRHNLSLVQDLGAWWEEVSGLPIPLGGIAVRRSLGQDLVGAIEAAVRESVLYARSHPHDCMAYVRAHAQEMEEDVVCSHIGLYVTGFSEDLGAEGIAAVEFFLEKGREVGALPWSRHSLFSRKS